MHPARPVLDAPHAPELERAQWKPRVLEDEALDVGPAQAVARDRLRVLGPEHDQELALREIPPDVGSERHRGIGHGREDAGGSRRDVVVDVVRWLAAEDGDDALL